VVEIGKGEAPRAAVLALGNFDGVHRGHQKVIADARAAADRAGAPLAVLRFEPHPYRWFHLDSPPFCLMTLAQQARALEGLGVDYLYVLLFDAKLAAETDEAFAFKVLGGMLGARHVAAGMDVTFGRDRQGGPEQLERYGRELGFTVSVTPTVCGADGRKFSATLIRHAVHQGDMALAAELLGRPFAIEGVVLHGAKLGRTIGFPTANIALGEYVRPAFGIYASRSRLPDGRLAPGVAYVGRRPTVGGLEERLEVFLFDFDEQIYGQNVETELVRRIRGDEKFNTLDEMRLRILDDCARARAILREDESVKPG
jgi:riboflavin kinase/FMN adenylyltransferase